MLEKPSGSKGFPRVKEAREALKAKAVALLEQYEKAILEAIASGDAKAAMEGIQWLMAHMPEDDGVKLIDTSVDKDKSSDSKGGGTSINIGFSLGGVSNQKAIGTSIIDITPEKIDAK